MKAPRVAVSFLKQYNFFILLLGVQYAVNFWCGLNWDPEIVYVQLTFFYIFCKFKYRPYCFCFLSMVFNDAFNVETV